MPFQALNNKLHELTSALHAQSGQGWKEGEKQPKSGTHMAT